MISSAQRCSPRSGPDEASTRAYTVDIADALAERQAPDVVHGIAHGAPRRVSLSGGAWTRQTPAEEAHDLARIGRAIGLGGCLRLWSCFTEAGPDGAAFVEDLKGATGGSVAAADGLVGAATLGGRWLLTAGTGAAAAQPRLTDKGAADHAAVMAPKT